VTAKAESQELVWRVSASLDAARPGEILLLDEDGQVLGPGAVRRAAMVGWGAVGSMVGLTALAVGALAGPLIGVLGGASALGVLAHQARSGRAFRHALALASAGRRDEAIAAVAELERRHVGDQFPPFIDYLTAKLEWQRGQFAAAQTRYERARARLADRRRGRGMYWVCSFDRAQLMAAAGNVEGARTARVELDQAPRGDYFAMELALTDLMIAFHASDAARLPDDDELYDWAKAALQTSRFGVSVALLAWAFGERNEPDMAAHLLREAPARLATEFLPESAPRLSTWLEARLAELPPDEDE
jgi:hypothetical protein